MSRSRANIAIVYAVAATALGGMPVWLIGAFAPMLAIDLELDGLRQGILIGAFFAFSAVVGMPVARFVDRYGWRAGIATVGAFCGLGLAISSVLGMPWWLMLMPLMFGAIANSTSQPTANYAVAQEVSQERQGLALGTKQAALPLATLVVGLAVPVFNFDGGWRIAFALMGLLALFMLIAIILEPGRTFRLTPKGVRQRITEVGQKRAERSAIPPTKLSLSLWLMAIGGGLGTSATMSLGGFLVVYAVYAGFSNVEAGFLLAAVSFLGVLARVLSGYLADHRQGKHLLVVALMMLTGSLGMVMIGATTSPWLITLGAVFAFGVGWSWNGLFHYAVIKYGKVSAAISSGLVQTAMSVGATFGPITFGAIASVSYFGAWIYLAVVLVLAASFVLVSRKILAGGR